MNKCERCQWCDQCSQSEIDCEYFDDIVGDHNEYAISKEIFMVDWNQYITNFYKS